MQDLVVVCLIVEKIWNVNLNCVKVNGAQNIGQGHWVNIHGILTYLQRTST